jgi:hypothetical protein
MVGEGDEAVLISDVTLLEVVVLGIIGFITELMLELVLLDSEVDQFPVQIPVQVLEEVLGIYGLISVFMLELVLVTSEVDQFPLWILVQVELGLIEELAAEVVKVVEESVEEVTASEDGVVLDVGVGETVGDPESPVQVSVQEPFQVPVHGPVHVGVDVFIAEMTLMMLDVTFCTNVTVVRAPSTVVTAVVVVAW